MIFSNISVYYVALSTLIASTYTYFKSLSQEATLKRKGVYEQQKVQRRRRERVVRVCIHVITACCYYIIFFL